MPTGYSGSPMLESRIARLISQSVIQKPKIVPAQMSASVTMSPGMRISPSTTRADDRSVQHSRHAFLEPLRVELQRRAHFDRHPVRVHFVDVARDRTHAG